MKLTQQELKILIDIINRSPISTAEIYALNSIMVKLEQFVEIPPTIPSNSPPKP
jgi:hypothetical protein